MNKISEELSLIRSNYEKSINIVSGLPFKQKDLIRTIEFYSNSKYLNGQKDELGRDKPFYNILNAICDVENAAKDIDTKDITITSDDPQHYTDSFLMSKDIYEWMKEVNFAKTLNDMRDTHTRYGSLLVKKVMQDDELKIEIPEWKNLITDQLDIENGAIVEVHYMTPMQLLKMTEWDQKAVKEVIEKAIRNHKGKRIPIYEVRGEFPRSYIKELDGKKSKKTDEVDFSYQLYYLAGEYTEFSDAAEDFIAGLTPLYWEDDTERVYKFLARKKKAGRAFGVGVVEEGEEAQIGTNDAVLKQSRAMEYTSRVIGQTASKKLKGRNMLTEVDDGQILEHEDNKPITAINLLPSGGLNQYPALIQQWFTQFERATSAYGAQRGESPTSRTSYRLQAAVLGQSGSVMETIQEELAVFITEIFDEWIVPYLMKKLTTEHILSHNFTLSELAEIDKNYSTHRANEMVKKMVLSGQIVEAGQYEQFIKQASDAIKQTKTTRFLQVPKDAYKKMKPKCTINVGQERQDKRGTAEALSGIMQIYQANPNLIGDPVLTQLFMKIVELSGAGVSPINLTSAFQEKAQQMANQQPERKISQSISYKDLPPEGQQQMAANVGIKIGMPEPVQGLEQAVPEG